ncbi:MAG: alpha/beta hydrolase [Deltaproteobacteria bacterium]|nr:alpha/beta hydrolase [Deltaproteobacteria bacterium]
MHINIKLLSLVVLVGIAVLISCTIQPENVAISSDGVEIRYNVQGEGEPALIFVHGFSRSHNDWARQMDYFSDRYTVVALDLAGFGESGNNRDNWTMEAFGSDVVSVIEHLNLNKVILIGHSMGTPAIMKAAIQNQGKIIGLVPVDMLDDVGQKRSAEEIEKIVEGYKNMMINPTEEIVRSWFVKEIDEELVSEFVNYYNTDFKVGWEESIRSTMKWISDSQPDDLTKIDIPICCINSDLSIPDYDLVRQYSQNFNAKIIKGVGHFVMIEAQDEFNRLLEECIQEFK